MNKRSVTLFEMLIVMVLVLALGALILPSLMDGMEERTFESAADTTNEQLMMARAHAQATGSPVEVTYSAQSSQVQARPFSPWLIGPDPSGDEAGLSANASDPLGFASGGTGEDGINNDRTGMIEESWACRDLNRGVRIVARPPFASASTALDSGSNSASDDDYETLEDLRNGGQDVRLAVFMPDGSALLGDPVWLNDDKGRCGKLSINPWSGLPIFQRLGNADAGANVADENGDAKIVNDATSDQEDNDQSSSKSAQPSSKRDEVKLAGKKEKSKVDSGSGGGEP